MLLVFMVLNLGHAPTFMGGVSQQCIETVLKIKSQSTVKYWIILYLYLSDFRDVLFDLDVLFLSYVRGFPFQLGFYLEEPQILVSSLVAFCSRVW